MPSDIANLNNIVRCTRYAFMPNRLHLCGPENQVDVLEFYSKTSRKKKTRTIEPVLEKFNTLYPYLKLIARANGLTNPFDERAVEAYWLGNNYLEAVPAARLFDHLGNVFNIQGRFNISDFFKFKKKFNTRALPHHNFHVFSIYRRTGHIASPHTLATMDACRISWGLILKIKQESFIVQTKPLIADNDGKIKQADFFIEREIFNYFEGARLIKNAMIGDFISIHWGCACELLTRDQANRLQKYTDLSLEFAFNL